MHSAFVGFLCKIVLSVHGYGHDSVQHWDSITKCATQVTSPCRTEFRWQTNTILCFVDRASLYNLANKSNSVHNLFDIFIYFSSLHVSGIHVPIIRRKLLYLCDTGICHSGWVASGLLVGFNPTSRSDATHKDWQSPVSQRYSNFLLMMGTWMPETCREE